MMPLGQLTDLKTWKGILSKLVYPVSLADFVDLDTDRINLTSKWSQEEYSKIHNIARGKNDLGKDQEFVSMIGGGVWLQNEVRRTNQKTYDRGEVLDLRFKFWGFGAGALELRNPNSEIRIRFSGCLCRRTTWMFLRKIRISRFKVESDCVNTWSVRRKGVRGEGLMRIWVNVR